MLRPLGVQETTVGPGVATLEVYTDRGAIVCLRHLDTGAEPETSTALFVGGALGGLSGPGDGLYQRVAAQTGGVRLHYRRPGELEDCVLDVLLVVSLLERRGVERFVLVGHSFGGAVAVAAGVAMGDVCAGVCLLSTQVPGTEEVARLAGRPLLVIHGDADEVLPADCSRYVHQEAAEPKELLIVPGEGHLFEGVVDALAERVTTFVGTARAGHG